MAGTFVYDEITYGLDDVYVCKFDFGANTYEGSVGTVAGPQLVEVEPGV